jgi:hypothetical protein
MISKSTFEILNSYWEQKDAISLHKSPPRWNNQCPITLNDVVFWEQIYHQPGVIGFYIALSPMAEFYIIVYDLFSHIPAGVKIFAGPEAVSQVLERAKELGIHLSSNRILV